MAYSQSIVLDINHPAGVIKLAGTVKAGENSVIYKGRESLGASQTSNSDPNTFNCELRFSYAFAKSDEYASINNVKGSGKVFNITNKTAKVKITCIEGYGLKENSLIIDVKPRTFSRIMFRDKDNRASGFCKKLTCELLQLY